MDNILLPVDDVMVEIVAKAICCNRMRRDADAALIEQYGQGVDDVEEFDDSFTRLFERIWAGTSAHDDVHRAQYRDDARAAISAINLKLLIT